MTDRKQHEKFIEEMLKKAEETGEAKPSTNLDVDEKEVQENMKKILEKFQQGWILSAIAFNPFFSVLWSAILECM